MTVPKEIKEKIKKLLAKGAEDGNDAEAAIALKMAGKLLDQYGLTSSEIKDESDIKHEDLIAVPTKMRMWADPLASILARCFNCEAIHTRYGKQRGHITFIGSELDMELCIWYFKRLKIVVAKQASSKYRLQKDQQSFGYGAVLSLGTRLRQMFIKPREEGRSVSERGLVVVKSDAVTKKTSELFPKITKRATKVTIANSEAVSKGRDAGNDISLNSVIGGNSQSKVG